MNPSQESQDSVDSETSLEREITQGSVDLNTIETTHLDGSGPPSFIRHAVYYIETVILRVSHIFYSALKFLKVVVYPWTQVENTLFKIPKSLINPDSRLSQPAESTQSSGDEGLARPETAPDFILSNVSAESFRSFLKLACPEYVGALPS